MKKLLISTVMAAFVTTVSAQEVAPDKTSGLDVHQYYNHALGAQIPAMEGYSLRGRRIVVEPGGATNEHSHAERPGIVYVLEGTVDEHRGKTKRSLMPGDTWLEDSQTVHWVKNTSDKPAVLLVFDLLKSD